MALIDPARLRDDEVLPVDADDRSRAELVAFWRARADGEWTTAIALRHVLTDLETFGAPESLLALTKTSIEDERRHTAWCRAMVQKLGEAGHDPQVKGDKPLSFHGATAAENALFRCIFAGCISETIALHVLRRSHQEISSAPIHEINRQHMAEEVNHARVGWGFLAWLDTSGKLDRATRTTLEVALPTLVELSVESWLTAAREHPNTLTHFGAIQRSHVETGVQEALNEVIIPGFAHYSLALPKNRTFLQSGR